MAPEDMLELKFYAPDVCDEEISCRDYFKALLTTLFEEVEGFSGKRPFGNSGWENDLSEPLIVGGVIKGHVRRDEDGYLQDIDFEQSELDTAIFAMIRAL